MSETDPGGETGNPGNVKPSPRAHRIAEWLNSLNQAGIPPQLRKHDGGRFTAREIQRMPENMKQRVLDAFDRRGDGDPFPHFDPPTPAGNGPGGPGNGPGGGGPHPGGNGPGNHGGPKNQNELRQNLAAMYGWSMAFLNHHPELKRLFNQAVQHTWTPERFVAELRDTKWFQNNSASVRQFMVNRATDPASWQADLNKTQAHIKNVWGSLFGVQLDHKLAEKFAIQAMKFGWSDEQINDHLVQTMNFRKLLKNDSLGGTAAQTVNQARSMAADYGVDPSEKWFAHQTEAVLKGNETMDGVLNSLKERAKNRYEAFADQLDAGKTMSDIADPYVQAQARLLELAPGKVQLTNNLIQKALTRRVDGKTQPMSVADFEDVVRKDPRWMHTQQANDQFSQTAYQALTNWGLI